MIPASNQMESSPVSRSGYEGAFPALPLAQFMLEDQEQDDLLDDQMMDQLIPDADEDFANTPGSEPVEGGSEDELQDNGSRGKRKRHHRHTTDQIQRLEAFFKECPHPDDRQRNELGRELGLEPLQVKFWFQNKRTQIKNQSEREENQRLKDENDRLLSENLRLKEALSGACCPNCGGPPHLGEMSIDEQELQAENARLQDEIGRISAIVAKHAGQQLMTFQMPSSSSMVGGFGAQPEPDMTLNDSSRDGEVVFRPHNRRPEMGRRTGLALAQVAAEELLAMSQLGEPIWTWGSDGFRETLNQEEYARAFPGGLGPKMAGLRTEASRETAVVRMDAGRLVDILMDVSKWSVFFSSIVTRATTVEMFATGIGDGGYDGALQLMTAELQVPTPLVPLRESLFLRYCKRHDGLWVVADVSMEVRLNPMARYRRRPSGCVIQELPNDYSKVVWIEHVEVDDSGVHEMYKSMVNCCVAFGAKRWVSTMTRQCERIASLLAMNSSTADIAANPDGTRNILKLAERMVVSFCSGVSGSVAHHWTNISGTVADPVRIRSRNNDGVPGRPPGVVLNASTSIWLPVTPKRVFELLRSESLRNEWDILLKGGMIHEAASIGIGQQGGNCVSIYTVGLPEEETNMMILQESCSDPTCSYVIYAPVDAAAVATVLSGGDPNPVALLPSGFTILPDRPCAVDHDAETNFGGSLLTVAFQILVFSGPAGSKISSSHGFIATVDGLLSCTCDRIRTILLGNSVH
ncbi:hypothetical protein OPV22_024394 [Ensete ventricosum]|uniref:Homeobox domain-containing protein n=1 Tax=Ensete ventricosum TaxID=4639 RepID=A0AAV8P8L0_ENSVE|nr:hypothetical protein OPV22_024394 [Ensete ventricosum]